MRRAASASLDLKIRTSPDNKKFPVLSDSNSSAQSGNSGLLQREENNFSSSDFSQQSGQQSEQSDNSSGRGDEISG